MSDRHRALPSWMAKKEEVKKKEPLKSRRRRKVARAAFYCMNEKELVEAAVSYLTNGACEDVALPTDQKVEFQDKEADTTVKIREQPASSKTKAKPVTEEDSSDCSDAQDATYVSETDLDITEVETVPYTESQRHQGPEGQRSGSVQNHSGLKNIELVVEKRGECLQPPADTGDDDALRLVREIFFT
ncbi:uncharacterized protein si:ch211-127m7.2 [Seriola aureovittata]|uniref:uncharacterized protein si:ch211-127m7.2 n=1 Tax=Seriola aureovittata TaxID=2871759 RepID=UPI0024BD7220|nr:uncharacterized protein si:ch211-127m7.2 [Seriola aureovittata]